MTRTGIALRPPYQAVRRLHCERAEGDRTGNETPETDQARHTCWGSVDLRLPGKVGGRTSIILHPPPHGWWWGGACGFGHRGHRPAVSIQEKQQAPASVQRKTLAWSRPGDASADPSGAGDIIEMGTGVQLRRPRCGRSADAQPWEGRGHTAQQSLERGHESTGSTAISEPILSFHEFGARSRRQPRCCERVCAVSTAPPLRTADIGASAPVFWSEMQTCRWGARSRQYRKRARGPSPRGIGSAIDGPLAVCEEFPSSQATPNR